MPNSLPPVRASTSPVRSAEISRRAKVISNSSPARLPIDSLIRLKRRMSTTSTAWSCPACSALRSPAVSTASVKLSRLGSPVRLSRSISARSERSARTSTVRSTRHTRQRGLPRSGSRASGASFIRKCRAPIPSPSQKSSSLVVAPSARKSRIIAAMWRWTQLRKSPLDHRLVAGLGDDVGELAVVRGSA